ncbi:MAG: NADPH-dependent 7-cyano-7-deazaguanine reductase QueF [Verrucomicrobia bacterium]|jgi:7-cyano-7-deazaguanine reductase|nr:NADPH-dependent 7-cyano-7-deazaguanine reductase QueF [Verrucomicrobiota bacterium]
MDIETFPNPNPERNYTIQHIQEEFTSTCPMTGHPDYATVVYSYVPDKVCIELKAMKLYLHSFRNKGIFFEAATNQIFADLNAAIEPRWARLETIWRGRGGVRSNVVVEDQQDGYDGPVTFPFSA